MKKILSLFLVAMIVVMLSSCGSKEETDSQYEYFANESTGEDTAISNSNEDSQTQENTTVSASFKAMMDEYEEFFDEYVEFMKKYNSASSTDMLSLMSDYSDFLTKYADYMNKLNSIDQSTLSTADLAYYTEVNSRIIKKLSEIGA